MENVASTSSPSLTQFEDFIAKNPGAENIVVSDGHIVAGSSTKDQDQAKTKEALKKAIQAKYPEQEELVNLVDQTWGELKTSGKSWDAHTIRQVIEQAEGDATWKDVGEEEISNGDEEIPEVDIGNMIKALDEYAQKVVEGLSPEERGSLQQQFMAAGLATAGVGMTALATHVPTHASNVALANLLTTISASLAHVGASLPMESLATPGHLAAAASLPTTHLAAATAIFGSAAASASVQATVATAASAVVPFIIAGAVAHRLYLAAHRISRIASSAENEINVFAAGLIACELISLPPGQDALFLTAIVSGLVGQHAVTPGLLEQVCHNVRDGALIAYLHNHPETAIFLAEEMKTLLLASVKDAASAVGYSITSTTTTTAAAATTTTTGGAVATTAPTALVHHSITATAAHGLSAVTSVIAATIAAHPGVAAAIVIGGTCAAAYKYVSGSSASSQPQTELIT